MGLKEKYGLEKYEQYLSELYSNMTFSEAYSELKYLIGRCPDNKIKNAIVMGTVGTLIKTYDPDKYSNGKNAFMA